MNTSCGRLGRLGFLGRARPAGTALLLLAAGCSVGPDHVRPPLVIELPATYVAERSARPETREHEPQSMAAAFQDIPVDAIQHTSGIHHQGAWWTAFGDTLLNRLVLETVAGNQDLRRAAARVLESRAQLKGAESDRWPRLEMGAAASRSHASMAAFGGRGSIDRTFYDANLTARYEADVWGRLSRSEEAAWAAVLQNEMNRRVVVQTLIADVVRTWLLERELDCQLDLTRRTVASYRSTQAMVEERYARGVVPAFEVHLARQNLLNAQAAEPEQQRLLAEAVRRLQILSGRYPAGRHLTDHEAAEDAGSDHAAVMPRPLPPVPAGLPSSLVEHRPDLLAAEANLHASTASIGAAKARLFPTLNLTASGGSVSNEFASWFTRGTDVWSLIAGLAMPLVNRGATRAQVRAAEARAEQALAGYYQAVLIALGEVENALDAEHHLARRETLLTASVQEARHALELAQQRYGAGLDSLLVTLEAQRRLLAATSALLATQRAHRTARVNLILALGGPWDIEVFEEPELADGAALQGDPE